MTVLLCLLAGVSGPRCLADSQATLVCSGEAGVQEKLALREIRRYVYLRTGQWLPLLEDARLPARGDAIVVARKDRPIIAKLVTDPKLTKTITDLGPQQYLLKTIHEDSRHVLLAAGGDEIGSLYGAYRLLEHFGVRFFVHGDVLPDRQIPWALPDLDELGQPLFELRGLNPWGSHPFGFDQWSADDYIAHIGQMAKMRMNFIGMHCYPEAHPYAEPTVWLGVDGDFDKQGRVTFSYPARYFNTLWTGKWGPMLPKRTGDYSFGGAQLFERDDWGPDVMVDLCPTPSTPESCNELFNRTGEQFAKAFTFAQLVGVKTCLGTESPITLPKALRERLNTKGQDPDDPAVAQTVYEGIFRRIMATHPLDYYWLWTPEGWTWSGNSGEQMKKTVEDVVLARRALKNVGAPFELATAGWVLGPKDDRAAFDRQLPKDIAISAISRRLGHEPLDEGFGRMTGRKKWAIPWMESDTYHGIANPQLFVGRTRKDAADALAYRSNGLMGLQWRTRIMGPNISALARAGWDQSAWNPEPGVLLPNIPPGAEDASGALGGNVANYPGREVADTEDDLIYQTCRYDMQGYRLKLPKGAYQVTLQFCEPHFHEPDKRVCGVTLQGRRVIQRLDIFAEVGPFAALDFTFDDVAVADGWLRIEFPRIESLPCISGIVIEKEGFKSSINCGGAAVGDYTADPVSPAVQNAFANRGLPADDFYADFALAMFGPEVARETATIFTQIDGRLPMPIAAACPSARFLPKSPPWDTVRKNYMFVDRLAALRQKVTGPGDLERFDYWLNTFRYFRHQAFVQCIYTDFIRLMEKIEKTQDANERALLAKNEALPLYGKLVKEYGRMYGYRLGVVSTWGGIMTIVNMEHSSGWWKPVMADTRARLEKVLADPLPENVNPHKEYRGGFRLIVPTLRSCTRPDEPLRLKVIVLSSERPQEAALHVRALGTKDAFAKIPLKHVARGAYTVSLPPPQELSDDCGLEYYVEATAVDGQTARFPASAPKINQTVIAF